MPKEYFQYSYIYKIDNKLHKAAYDGDFEKVKQYVSNGINIYKQTHFQETPLFLSMCKQHYQIIDYLLRIYKNDLNHVISYFNKHPEKKYTWKDTTVLIAFGKEQVAEVKQLVTKMDKNHSKRTSVIVLLKENNFSIPEVLEINVNGDDSNVILDIIEKTFDNGVFDLNQKMLRGDTLLHVAAHQGLADYLFQLIEMGADYMIKNNENITPICYAALNGQIQILEKMFNALNIDILDEIDENISIIFMCAMHNEYETFIYLLEKIVEARSIKYSENRNTSLANIFDTKASFIQNTLFHAVIHCGFIDFGINCLQYNPDLTTVNNLGNTVLHTTMHHTANSDKLAMEIIQRNYTLLLKRNKVDLTPFHLMASNGKTELFMHVYETYADVRDTFFTDNLCGYDVLEETIRKNYYELAEFIIINYKNNLTDKLRLLKLLNVTASKNSTDLLKLLLDLSHVNPNDSDLPDDLQYPIITALKSRQPDNFYLLYNYDAGKIFCIKDKNNNNLLKYAVWKRIEKIDTDQCGSLYDSIYNINYSENDSEYQELVDEQNKKVTQIKENEKKKIILGEEEAFKKENLQFNEIFSILINELDYNFVNDKGRNLIFTAVKKSNIFALEKLLELNVDPNVIDLNGNKAIHFVTDVNILKLLLKHIDVENIKFSNKYGNTVLHNIVKNYNFENSNMELLNEIIKLGGDVNKRNSSGETTLHLVSSIEYYKILIDNNADISARDNQGNTILHSALSRLNFAVAKEILKNNIDLTIVNNYNTSYLNYFVRLDDKYMREYIDLLDNNATNDEMFKKHYNIIDQYDRPLLFVSCFNNNYCIKKILSLNNVDITINYNGQTLLHAAVISSNMDLAKYLIKHNIQLDVCDDFEKTPLMKCIEYGNDNLLLLLLENGANVNIKGNDGNVALHYACERNSIASICALLKYKSKFIKNDFMKLPFDLCSPETKKLFSFLLEI